MPAKKTKATIKTQTKHHNVLLSPVHPHLGWLTTASIGLSSFFIMITVLAQDMMAPPPGGTMPPPPSGDMMQQPSGYQQPGGMMPPPGGDMYQQPGGYQPPPGGTQPYSGTQQYPNNMQQPGGYQQPGMMQPPTGNFNSGQQGQMGPGGNSQFGPQGQMGQGQEGFKQGQGPSEEQMQQMDEQRLKMMKQGLSKMSKEILKIKNYIASYKKKGISMPDELNTAISEIENILAKVKDSTDPDELEGVMESFQTNMETVQEWMQKLPKMTQILTLLKQANKELVKADKAYATDSKKIASSKLDLSSNLADFRTAIDNQKALLNEIKELQKTDFDSAFDKLSDEFFGNLDNMWENEKVIQMALNLRKSIVSQIPSELKNSTNLIKTLKRKKIDTTELELILSEAKAKFEEIKALFNAKPMDVDAIIEALDSLYEKRQTFNDKVQELTGQNEFMPQISQGQNFQMNIPQGFMMPQQGPGNMQGGGSGQNTSMPSQSGMQTCNINGVEMPGPCTSYPGQTGQGPTIPGGSGQ